MKEKEEAPTPPDDPTIRGPTRRDNAKSALCAGLACGRSLQVLSSGCRCTLVRGHNTDANGAVGSQLLKNQKMLKKARILIRIIVNNENSDSTVVAQCHSCKV